MAPGSRGGPTPGSLEHCASFCAQPGGRVDTASSLPKFGPVVAEAVAIMDLGGEFKIRPDGEDLFRAKPKRGQLSPDQRNYVTVVGLAYDLMNYSDKPDPMDESAQINHLLLQWRDEITDAGYDRPKSPAILRSGGRLAETMAAALAFVRRNRQVIEDGAILLATAVGDVTSNSVSEELADTLRGQVQEPTGGEVELAGTNLIAYFNDLAALDDDLLHYRPLKA